MRTALAVVMAVALVASLSGAARRPSRRVCRLECREAIDVCAASGARRRFCRTRLVQQCRRKGLAACALPPTTTTTPTTSTTTTTIASGPVVNGCDPRVADDHRGEAEVVVEFGRGFDIFDYAPECIAVSRGAKVRFEGSFGTHPLVGGEVVGRIEHPDPASPFGQVRSGATASFVMTLPGVYGYYCDEHSVFLMYGAVVVVP